MESPSSTVLALSCLFIVIITFRRWRRRAQMKYPPGPKPWPVIGNFNLVGPMPHLSLHQLAQQHGPLMKLTFGSVAVVVASSAAMAEQILKTNDTIFSSRPHFAAGKLINHNYKDVVWASYGPYWRQARKIFLTEFLSPKMLASWEHIRVEELRAFLTRLDDQVGPGRPVLIKGHLARLTLSTISRIVLGKLYFTDPGSEPGSENPMPELGEIGEMLEEWFVLNGVLNLGDWMKWARWLDLQGYEKRMRALSVRLNRFHDLVFDDHNDRKKRDKDFVGKDMVDVLIQIAENPSLEVPLDYDSLKGLTQDLITGGTDTSAVVVEWAMSELLKHPNIMVKAKEELDKVVGRDKWVEEIDLPKLPFLEAIMKETMRLHPPSPLLPPRIASQDCRVAGHHVPKGTVAFINVWTIGRDPTTWGDDAHEFRPERFLNGCDIDMRGRSFELLPFGSGRRMCPGYTLGLKVSYSILANMLHGFDWELAGNMKSEELSMEEIYGLVTPRKYPLVLVLQRRLESHLYKIVTS